MKPRNIIILFSVIILSSLLFVLLPPEITGNSYFIVSYVIILMATAMIVGVRNAKTPKQKTATPNKIIATTDTTTLKSMLKKKAVFLIITLAFLLFLTVLGTLHPENWQPYHWLFPFLALVNTITLLRTIILYHKL